MTEPTQWWRRPASLTWSSLVAVAAVITLVAGGLGAVAAITLTAGPGSCNTERVASQTLPAVVTVLVSSGASSGSGSGSIISSDGMVLTNDHVIAPAASRGTIDVLLNDGTKLAAKLVGTDPLTDLAVLKVDRGGLPTLRLAPNENLRVGQPVVALGAPLGLSGTVTSGIISALNRNVPAPKASGGTTVLVGSVQTDAAINPGNSGGPLVTCAGLQIGVNTAISTVPNSDGTAGGGSVGIGWAVPAATAQRISSELIANGHASHPWLGLSASEISADVADRFKTPSGLFVQAVDAGGPAATAGLEAGDVITRLNGAQATSMALSALRLSANVGDQVPVEYIRDGARASATITLAEQR
jgi:putative serine protease PepD